MIRPPEQSKVRIERITRERRQQESWRATSTALVRRGPEHSGQSTVDMRVCCRSRLTSKSGDDCEGRREDEQKKHTRGTTPPLFAIASRANALVRGTFGAREELNLPRDTKNMALASSFVQFSGLRTSLVRQMWGRSQSPRCPSARSGPVTGRLAATARAGQGGPQRHRRVFGRPAARC